MNRDRALSTAKALWLRVAPLYTRYVGPKRQAALMGILIALAQPPYGFLPGLLGYAVLLWSLDQDLGPKPLKRAFALGWWAGFGYFFVSCFWVAEAFLVDIKTHGWMAPFAATLLPSGIALFWGAAFVLYRRFRPANTPWPVLRWLYFAGLFCLFETLRGTILTGFPWNPAGATWRAGSAMSQFASVLGVYGLSLLTVTLFTSPAVCVRGNGWRGYRPVIASVIVGLSVFTFGMVRLHSFTPEYTDVLVRIVQPNINQQAKWTPGTFRRIFTDYVAMTKAPVQTAKLQTVTKVVTKTHPDIVIWPEGALPKDADSLLSAQSWTAKVFSELLIGDQTLLWGAYHSDYDRRKGIIWRNSMLSLHRKGELSYLDVAYSKFKLVPFGEVLPFESVLERIGFKELVNVGDGFTPGERTRSVKLEDMPRFLPLICYEGLFPGLSFETYKGSDDIQRPQWIVNISNDAWFGPTSGPAQHFNLSSYRGIEEGLPTVRSTPTGMSAAIDPMGRVIKASLLGTNVRGYRDFVLQKPAKLTAYARYRYLNLFFIALFCLIPITIVTFLRVAKKNVLP